MAPSAKKRVYWTSEEESQVVTAALQAMMETEDKSLLWPFIEIAQKAVLPHDRQRTITGSGCVKDDLFDALCQEKETFLEDSAPLQLTVEKPTIVNAPEKPREEILASLTTEEILGLAAKRFASIVDMLLQRKEQSASIYVERPSQPPLALPKLSQANQPPTARRPRVMMYGFLPGQQGHILNKMGNLDLELVFYDRRRTEPPPSCQWVVAMNKIAHKAWNKMKDKMGENITLVEGITDAVKALADINAKIGQGQ